MSPEIVTHQGELHLKLLPGEHPESERGKPANLVYSASNELALGNYRKVIKLLRSLGMPFLLAKKLTDGIKGNIEGVSVKFTTVFEGAPEEGGKRTYKDFR